MATITANNWDEFVTAIQTSGAVVICPENATWDLRSIEDVPEMEVKCSEVYGNGTKIINLKSSASSVFTLDSSFSFYDIHFLEFDIKYSAFFSYKRTGVSTAATTHDWYGCMFSGNSETFAAVFDGVYNDIRTRNKCDRFMVSPNTHKGCAFEVTANHGYLFRAGGSGSYTSVTSYLPFRFTSAHITFTGSTLVYNQVYQYFAAGFFNCLIDGVFTVSNCVVSEDSVFDCQCTEIETYQKFDRTIVNKDKCRVYPSSAIAVTSEELLNAEYIKNTGFLIGSYEQKEYVPTFVQGDFVNGSETVANNRVRSSKYGYHKFYRYTRIKLSTSTSKSTEIKMVFSRSNSDAYYEKASAWIENNDFINVFEFFDVYNYKNLSGNAAYFKLVLKYSDDSAITPSDVGECTLYIESNNGWEITDNGLTNTYFQKIPDVKPEPIIPVKQPPYIIVYDMRTEQNGFNNHGLCILHPSECIETETLNGGWEVTLTHPIDSAGLWRYIVESNILKVDGQLFIIRKIEQSFQSGKGIVKAYAEHIFYVMNEAWISPFDEWQGTVQEVVNRMTKFNEERYAPQDIQYSFTGKSDIDKTIPKQVEGAGETPVQAMIGEAGLISQVGGFLYRDNFYFSINKEMENSQKDAFDIRVGKDLMGIRRIVDLSNFVTFFLGYLYDSTYFFGVYWIWNKGNEQFYRTVKQSKTFNYSSLGLTFADEAQRLEQDVTAYFDAYCKPLLSYEFDIQDLSQNPEYSEFTNMPRYKVGDVGKVYDERLGVTLNLPITKTRKNHVTHRVEKVWIGNAQRTFTRPAAYNVDISALGRAEETEIVGQLKDYEYNDIYDAAGNEILIKIERGDG